MATSDTKINFAGLGLNGNRHLCAFFHSEDEEFRAVLPFMVDGLAAGEKVLYIVNAARIEEHRRRLTAARIDLQAAEQSGQLEVIAWPPVVKDGTTSKPDQAKMIDDLLRDARNQGYRRTRVVGDMDWAAGNHVPDVRLIALEAQLDAVYSQYDVWAICGYDLSRFSGVAVIDVMRTHPATVIGGVIQRNPFYIPPEQMLAELRERNESGGDEQVF
jgi:hypothetical protein